MTPLHNVTVDGIDYRIHQQIYILGKWPSPAFTISLKCQPTFTDATAEICFFLETTAATALDFNKRSCISANCFLHPLSVAAVHHQCNWHDKKNLIEQSKESLLTIQNGFLLVQYAKPGAFSPK